MKWNHLNSARPKKTPLLIQKQFSVVLAAQKCESKKNVPQKILNILSYCVMFDTLLRFN